MVVIVEVVEEAIVVAVEEAVLAELTSRETQSSMPKKKRVVDSRASQEMLIHSTNNLVLAEARENLMRRRVATVVVTGVLNQIVLTREVRSMKACQMEKLNRSLPQPVMLQLRRLLNPRLRKRRRLILSRKKLSLVLVLRIS